MNKQINIDSQALQGLGNGQRVLIVADGPARAAVAQLDSIAAEAERHGLRVTVKRSNGQYKISLPEDSGAPRRGGSIEILTTFQARDYGAFRGRVVDQLLHPFDQLPEEAIPCLITGNGISFNYYTGAATVPANVQL